MVAVGEVSPNPFQPRTEIAEEALAQLAASIREQGVMQPIVVRRGSGDAPYEIVAGERRWRAAMLAGLRSVPALVRELSDEQSAEWALVENVQREDLNAMERAWALRTLCEKFGLTQAQAGDKVAID
ncbi:MAG: ParB/RepB/Spo0J family partition protein, partial [Phycisphaeraceae bacterium]|nr:ParB/RepB/Spo0J family partition protein [Phycisphaeraceae bacterium]